VKLEVDLGNVLEALTDGWRHVPLLKAAEGDPGKHRSPFRVHRLGIERSDAIIMLAQPSSGCKVHAADGYSELLSKSEPVGTGVNISVCVVNSH
jgi:hypothetical protein